VRLQEEEMVEKVIVVGTSPSSLSWPSTFPKSTCNFTAPSSRPCRHQNSPSPFLRSTKTPKPFSTTRRKKISTLRNKQSKHPISFNHKQYLWRDFCYKFDGSVNPSWSFPYTQRYKETKTEKERCKEFMLVVIVVSIEAC